MVKKKKEMKNMNRRKGKSLQKKKCNEMKKKTCSWEKQTNITRYEMEDETNLPETELMIRKKRREKR